MTITNIKKENFNNFNGHQYYFDGKNLFIGILVYDPHHEEYQLREARKNNRMLPKINSYRKEFGDNIFVAEKK